MKFILKRQKSCNPKTYYQFTVIDLQFVNTFQVMSFNATFCNIFLQVFHKKK